MDKIGETVVAVTEGVAEPPPVVTAETLRAEARAKLDEIRAEYRSPKQVDGYLHQIGVRRRMREEVPLVDADLIPPGCVEWCEKAREGASLILCGPPGTGKTTAAVWCLTYLWKTSDVVRVGSDVNWGAPRAWFAKTSELYDAVFQKVETDLKAAEQSPVLVLDDWGADYEHAWPLSRLDRVIDRRWDDLLATIITTNLQPEQIKESLPRAYDRLSGFPGPGVVVLDRPSLRQKVK